MTTKYSCICASLLFFGSAMAGHVREPSASWNGLRDKNLHMGFSVKRVDRIIVACQANGLSVSEAEDLLCPVYVAHAEELPTDCVFLKIEEGLAKQIAWRDVHLAADRRLECMRTADSLIMSVRDLRGGQHNHLVMHLCLALESGLPKEVLNEVLHRPDRLRYGRMIHVIEAGESLQLAGLEPEQILRVMNDCVDRDLNCVEIMRVVDLLQRGLRSGVDFDTLYVTLWAVSGKDGAAP